MGTHSLISIHSSQPKHVSSIECVLAIAIVRYTHLRPFYLNEMTLRGGAITKLLFGRVVEVK